MRVFGLGRRLRIGRRSMVAAVLPAMSALFIACSAAPSDPRPDSERTTWVRTELFGPQCRCHMGGPDSFANLDLYTSGLEERLVGRPATECKGQTLVVPGDPDGSYLVRKLTDAVPACGRQMPLATPLQNDQLQAVRDWVASLDRSRALP